MNVFNNGPATMNYERVRDWERAEACWHCRYPESEEGGGLILDQWNTARQRGNTYALLCNVSAFIPNK